MKKSNPRTCIIYNVIGFFNPKRPNTPSTHDLNFGDNDLKKALIYLAPKNEKGCPSKVYRGKMGELAVIPITVKQEIECIPGVWLEFKKEAENILLNDQYHYPSEESLALLVFSRSLESVEKNHSLAPLNQ